MASDAAHLGVSDRQVSSGVLLAGLMIVLASSAALLAGWVPIGFSIAAVFLFAGPHNWFEARYILGRLPARPGKLSGFFIVSLAGIVGLTVVFAVMPSYLRGGTAVDYTMAYAIWNTVFLLWAAALLQMRAWRNPRFDAGWVWAVAFALIAGNWLMPFWFSMALVYGHPLMALAILDCELGKSHPGWRPAYRLLLLLLSVYVAILWIRLAHSASLPGDDSLTTAITQHAGDGFFSGVSNHFLVALHTFLEMVHYGVWILILPLIALKGKPWTAIPAARRSLGWRRGVGGVLLAGAGLVVVLWVCFLLDYGTTRQIYFTAAMLHVLAEIPFLLYSL